MDGREIAEYCRCAVYTVHAELVAAGGPAEHAHEHSSLEKLQDPVSDSNPVLIQIIMKALDNCAARLAAACQSLTGGLQLHTEQLDCRARQTCR